MGRVVVIRIFQAVAWLVVAGLVVEFYLAGAALFGVTTFQPHQLLGVLLGVAILLLLSISLVARSGRRTVGQVAVLVLLTLVQLSLPSLRSVVPAIAALHVVNAGLLVGLTATIAREASRMPVESASEPTLSAVGSRT